MKNILPKKFWISDWTKRFGFLTSNVENIVASDQDLAQVAGEGAVNVLLGVSQLEVHVAVDGDQVSLIYQLIF